MERTHRNKNTVIIKSNESTVKTDLHQNTKEKVDLNETEYINFKGSDFDEVNVGEDPTNDHQGSVIIKNDSLNQIVSVRDLTHEFKGPQTNKGVVGKKAKLSPFLKKSSKKIPRASFDIEAGYYSNLDPQMDKVSSEMYE